LARERTLDVSLSDGRREVVEFEGVGVSECGMVPLKKETEKKSELIRWRRSWCVGIEIQSAYGADAIGTPQKVGSMRSFLPCSCEMLIASQMTLTPCILPYDKSLMYIIWTSFLDWKLMICTRCESAKQSFSIQSPSPEMFGFRRCICSR
jgi:hypothetical protein